MRILHVEDNHDVVAVVREVLERENIAVDFSSTAADAEEKLFVDEYDLLLLDFRLPDAKGSHLVRGLRDAGATLPILMLTVLSDPDFRIEGLDCGADDYLCKPFHSGELLARIRTLLRRGLAPPKMSLRVGDVLLDPTTRKVFRNNQPVSLLAKEFSILEYLMRDPGRVRSKEMIGENVWGLEYDPRSNLIESYISRLRTKLESKEGPRLIRTVKGAGYCIEDPALSM